MLTIRCICALLCGVLIEGQAQEVAPVSETPLQSGAVATGLNSKEAEQDFLEVRSFLTDPPLPLLISRKSCDNFLTDKDLLQNHLAPDGSPSHLSGVFEIASPSATCKIIWDARTCRMLGIQIPLEDRLMGSPTPNLSAAGSLDDASLLSASGPHPLRRTYGASGDPVYFGFRWLHGRPGFLYTIGSLIVEEWIWLEDATLLCQHFRIRSPESDVIVLLPSDWSDEVSSNAGTIKKGVLTVPAADAAEFAITSRLKSATVAPAP